MHEEILTSEQKELLPLIKSFSDKFGLVGGTAIAFHIGHRRSVDFDLFSSKQLSPNVILDKIRSKHRVERTLVARPGELTILVNGVKITFYKHSFNIDFSVYFKNVIKVPDLLTLGAMKSFALGHRAKWKDYVDLFFIFKKYSLRDVAQKANLLFGREFNEKLLREQLAYFDDIDYSEEVDFLKGFEVSDEVVKKFLTETSLEI